MNKRGGAKMDELQLELFDFNNSPIISSTSQAYSSIIT